MSTRAPEPVDLTGLRVLVLEDSFLVADMIADVLRSRGCEVIGPLARVSRALAVAESAPLDGALLDVNLGGELCFPVADALQRRGIPFVFLTGYDDSAIFPESLRNARRLSKPVDDDGLPRVVAEEFGNAG
jgi:DNA-binding response OmpR family regulator